MRWRHLLDREFVLKFLDKPVFAEFARKPFGGVVEFRGFRQSCQAGKMFCEPAAGLKRRSSEISGAKRKASACKQKRPACEHELKRFLEIQGLLLCRYLV